VTSSQDFNKINFRKIVSCSVCLPLLMVLFIFIWAGAAVAQENISPYASETDARNYVKAEDNAKLIRKMEVLKGRKFWYKPNLKATQRVEFFEPNSTSEADELPSRDIFFVQTETSFTITGYGGGKYGRYYLNVEFPDGKVGRLAVNLSANTFPDKYHVIKNIYTSSEDFYEFREYIYPSPPQEIFAAERKVAVERKARQAKVDAERRARGGVIIGMTPRQVLNSNWGRPSHVNRTTTQHGSREQWVYGGGNNLYFENGKLTAVQN